MSATEMQELTSYWQYVQLDLQACENQSVKGLERFWQINSTKVSRVEHMHTKFPVRAIQIYVSSDKPMC